jgi:Divergent InlB B-repeat domain
VKRVIIFLILGALIIGVVGCSSGAGFGGIFGGYNIKISSGIGGTVTTPGEGLFRYASGTVVTLVATPDVGYHFVCWISNAGTIANVNAATTTITVNNYYFVTASFHAN